MAGGFQHLLLASAVMRTLILRLLVAPLEVLPPAGQVLLLLHRLALGRLR